MPQVFPNGVAPMYRIPVLKKSKKGWRIEFYYAENGNLKRSQLRVDKYKKRFETYKAAELWIQSNICEPLHDRLRSGWTPADGKLALTPAQLTLSELLEDFNRAKGIKFGAGVIGESALRLYKYFTNVIQQSMTPEQGVIADLPIDKITTKTANEFIFKIKTLRNLSVTSTNNLINFCRMLYRHAVESGYISTNPFVNVAMLKGEQKSKRLLTEQEQHSIAERLKTTNLPFYIFTQLVYCDLIRPVEIFRLQCKDVDVCTHSIVLPASKTKNHKARTVFIPVQLRKLFDSYLEAVRFNKRHSNDYLFHADFKPAAAGEPLPSSYASIRWRELCRELNISDDCKLYGLRHTGITDLLNVLPANTVRLHADHSDLKQTMHYANHANDSIRTEIAEKCPIYG